MFLLPILAINSQSKISNPKFAIQHDQHCRKPDCAPHRIYHRGNSLRHDSGAGATDTPDVRLAKRGRGDAVKAIVAVDRGPGVVMERGRVGLVSPSGFCARLAEPRSASNSAVRPGVSSCRGGAFFSAIRNAPARQVESARPARDSVCLECRSSRAQRSGRDAGDNRYRGRGGDAAGHRLCAVAGRRVGRYRQAARVGSSRRGGDAGRAGRGGDTVQSTINPENTLGGWS